jgi:hypothetical protein
MKVTKETGSNKIRILIFFAAFCKNGNLKRSTNREFNTNVPVTKEIRGYQKQRKTVRKQTMQNRNKIITMILLALGFFALPQGTQAVSPPPDGGYPGANTAEGQDALLNLTTGGWNTAIGWLSLRANTTGQFNTGVGAATLYANTGDQSTATGVRGPF